MNLLFIERNLETITQHLAGGVDFVLFDSSNTYEQLLSSVTKQYTNIGIFSHGDYEQFEFVESINNSENVNFKNFLIQLKTKTSFQTFDLLSCFFGNNLGYISQLESELSINMRASTNITGNEPFGDWIMETDNTNIKNLYFSDTVAQFNQVLLTPGFFNHRNSYNMLYNEILDNSVVNYNVYATATKMFLLRQNGTVKYLFSNDAAHIPPAGLTGVSKIFSNDNAHAALKLDGSVVTWGNVNFGADSSGVNVSGAVEKIYVSGYSMAALKGDGSVVTWGDAAYGGDSSSVSADLTGGVVKIQATASAFAALKTDGSVVTWGFAADGGDSSGVSALLQSGVSKIYSTPSAFAALKTDGSVVTWGNSNAGGDSSSVSADLQSGVVKVFPTGNAIAAIKTDGSVVTWGFAAYGGDSSSVSASLVNIVDIYGNLRDFVAIDANNNVISWGSADHATRLNANIADKIVKLYQSASNMVALRESTGVDTSVTSGWGTAGWSSLDPSLTSSGVVKVYPNYKRFAVLRDDASAFITGSSATLVQLNDVLHFYNTKETDTIALHTDGSMSRINTSGNIYEILNEYLPVDTLDFTSIRRTVETADFLDDNRIFEEAFATSAASSSGDPYVTTLCGNKFKLPNATKMYRMLESTLNNKDLIVNASVSQLTNEEINYLKSVSSKYTDEEPVVDGYFYDKFYISYGERYAIFDRNINMIETNITEKDLNETFYISYSKNQPFSCPIQGNSVSDDVIIHINKAVIKLKKIDHPQIINGLEIKINNTQNVKGILNTYLHPKNYSIKKLDSTKLLQDKDTKKLYKKEVYEKWINAS